MWGVPRVAFGMGGVQQRLPSERGKGAGGWDGGKAALMHVPLQFDTPMCIALPHMPRALPFPHYLAPPPSACTLAPA